MDPGIKIISLSWIFWKPRMLEPSKPIPSFQMLVGLSTSIMSSAGIEKCCHRPGRSLNLRSMISILCLLNEFDHIFRVFRLTVFINLRHQCRHFLFSFFQYCFTSLENEQRQKSSTKNISLLEGGLQCPHNVGHNNILAQNCQGFHPINRWLLILLHRCECVCIWADPRRRSCRPRSYRCGHL